MTFLDDFLIRAALAGIGLALAVGPLGCFVVWRRLAYFSDATAHAAILGVALALATEIPVFAGTLILALVMAFLVARLAGRNYAADTVLGVLAHSALALGIVAVALIPGARVDLSAYLFGDILAVSLGDLALIWGGSVTVLGVLVWRWQNLLLATLNPDLAFAAGLNPRREDMILTIILAVTVALAIKIVGVLLIGAMLIIPAAAARSLATTPERMAVWAAILGGASVLLGLWASFQGDTPTGPSIVCAAALIFVLSLGARLLRRQSAR